MTSRAVVVDPRRRDITFARSGQRELFVVVETSHLLWHRWIDEHGTHELGGFIPWAAQQPKDPVCRSFSEYLGLDWYRSRIDDVLAALDEAWLVLRSEQFERHQKHLATFVDVGFEPPTPPPVDGDRLRDIVRQHRADAVLHDLAARYESSGLRRLGLDAGHPARRRELDVRHARSEGTCTGP